MGEIKFRAWSKNKNEFVNVVGFDLIKNTARIHCGANIYCNVSLNDLEIELFTGLKDKNGIEIYDGDKIGEGIVKFCEYYDEEGYYDCKHIGWIVERSDGKRDTLIDCIKNKVIGNIHENKDILSKGN